MKQTDHCQRRRRFGNCIAHRLFRCGFDIVITEIEQPTVIRRSVAFANAIFEGKCIVEDITAVKSSAEEVAMHREAGIIPVVVDPLCKIAFQEKPWAIVDAILAKHNIGTRITDASVVIGVGPGFTAGVDVHRVVETMRGHDLGRVISSGTAKPNTGCLATSAVYVGTPCIGAARWSFFRQRKKLVTLLKPGMYWGFVGEAPVIAIIGGVLRGMLQDGLKVYQKMKIGDVDPRQKWKIAGPFPIRRGLSAAEFWRRC